MRFVDTVPSDPDGEAGAPTVDQQPGSFGSDWAGRVAQGTIDALRQGSLSPTGEPLIKRFGTTKRTIANPAPRQAYAPGEVRPPTQTVKDPRYSTLDAFVGEFYRKSQDKNFMVWYTSRAKAAGLLPTSRRVTLEDLETIWQQLGKKVQSNPAWKGTPEQYLEYLASNKIATAKDVAKAIKSGIPMRDPETGKAVVGTSGGARVDPDTGLPLVDLSQASGELVPGEDIMGFDEVYGDAEVPPPPPPITTEKHVSRTTINPLAANAATDQMAQALLGRMATKKEMARYRAVMNGILKSNPTVSTVRRDATDPYNVKVTTTTKDGASAADAQAAAQMRMQRSSEGMAFNAGKMFEQALRMMGG